MIRTARAGRRKTGLHGLLGVLLTAAPSCSLSQRWRTEEPSVTQTAHYRPAGATRGALANGVGIYCSPFDHPATTRVALVFGHGYADDDENLGQARLFARWLETEAEGKQAALFDTLGAQVRVHTRAHATVLEVDVLHADARMAVDALTQLVENIQDEAAFRAAQRHALATLARAYTTPHTLAALAARQAALAGSKPSLMRLGIGSKASLHRQSLEDALLLRDQWIASTPLSVAVVGPHTVADVSTWADAALSRWSARDPASAHTERLPRRPKTIIVVPVAGLDPAVVLAGTTMPLDSPAAFSAFRTGRSLANGQLREALRRTYGVSGDVENLGHTGFAYASARVPARDAYNSALVIAAAFGRSKRFVTDDWALQVRRADAAHWTGAKMKTSSRAKGLYDAIEMGRELDATPPFGRIGRTSAAEIRDSLATEFSYDGMQIVIAGDLDQLRHALRGTSFQVRWPTDLLEPVVPSGPPAAQGLPAASTP